MVEQVAQLRKTNPEICNPILDAIEGVTKAALHHLHDQAQLGRFMNVNHALLEALGVGHPALSRIVLAARSAGAYGAKLTGAGGGGCMIAFCPKSLKGRVAGAIESCEARAIVTTLDQEGARKEKDVP